MKLRLRKLFNKALQNFDLGTFVFNSAQESFQKFSLLFKTFIRPRQDVEGDVDGLVSVASRVDEKEVVVVVVVAEVNLSVRQKPTN